MSDVDELETALRQLTGHPTAEFRDGQREAIDALVEDRRRVLVVQRTGWGKSAVYFVATHFLRQQGLGPTLLISPLLALMRNQIAAAERFGLRCETINSASATSIAHVESLLRDDLLDVLLVSPERLANPEFADKIMPLVGRRPGLIVIDEVHCISDWGHDFRPDYRRIGRMVELLAGTGVPILGCTATANDRVVSDVTDLMRGDLVVLRGPLRRDGLALSALALDRPAERLAWLSETIPELDGTGIVYCLTVSDVETVAAWLNQQGIVVDAYFGALDNDARIEAERKLLGNEIKALVATTALGMGYDKPDLSFVVHFQSPGSPVAYYQQVGRAGRALESSRGVLLRGLEDQAIQDFFIDNAFAAEDRVNDVVKAFDHFDDGASTVQIQTRLNISAGALEHILKQLVVDGVLERVRGTVYARTLQPYAYPHDRVQQVTEARRLEQLAMLDYFETTGCRMRFLSILLDDPSAEDCGVCDNCVGSSVARELPLELVAAAEGFLRGRPIVIAPRKQAIDDESGSRKGIPAEERLEEGRALCRWGDGGWGTLVRDAKLRDGSFDDRLVDALVELVAEWDPDLAPAWVTCIPSLRHPELVPGFAQRVAQRLGVPFVDAVVKVTERPEQRLQQNSIHQQRNVAGAYSIVGATPSGPVLLVDDVLYSGWTLTEVGRALRRAGSGPVHPVVLASSAGRDT